MKYCIYCGAELNESDKFCTNCGEPVVQVDEQAVMTTEVAYSDWAGQTSRRDAGEKYYIPSSAAAPARPRRSSMMPFAIVGALCVLAFVFGLFFVIGRNSVRNAAPSEQETTISPVSVYLSAYEGYVAIFTSDSTDPYQISNVPVSSLSPEIAAQLEAHVLASSLDDAKVRVEQYRASMTESAPVSQNPGSTTESLTAASLPKTWNGHFEGYSQYAENGSIDRTVQMTFSEVSDDGHISGLCSIGEGDTGPGSGTGSYYIEGTIDWNTRAIELHGTDWAEQGDLKYMRRYEGTVSEAFDSLNGTCAFDDGSRSGAWQMVAY